MAESEEIEIRELINKVRQERNSGKGFSIIHNELLKQGIAEEKVKTAIRFADNLELKRLAMQSEMDADFDKMMWGVAGILLGLVLAVFLYPKAAVQPFYYVLIFGPFVGGYIYFRAAFKHYNTLKTKKKQL